MTGTTARGVALLREAAEFLEIRLSAVLKIFQQSYGSLPQTAQNPLYW